MEYENVFVKRVAKLPHDRMDAQYTEAILASGDEQNVREHIAALRRATDDLLNSTVA